MDKACFIGPRAENADELERLLLEVLRDHVFWRRNFHPEDPRLIAEADKRGEPFASTSTRLRDELFQILSELKRGAPLFSPRQIGHMVGDPSLPALVGYFAGLLYNQNNVVTEAAPETVRKEHGYVAALARMVGYPRLLPEKLAPAEARRQASQFSWGHLTGGGTVANLEALWVARNVRLYPLAVRLLASESRRFGPLGELEVVGLHGRARMIRELPTFELLNLPVPQITDLHLRIRTWLSDRSSDTAQEFDRSLPSVRRAGLAGLMQRYNERFARDPMRLPVVFSSRAAHYGWPKAMDIAGLGAGSLRTLPVDRRLRLDIEELAYSIRAAVAAEEQVLMVIGILGTTEEGAVDPLHRIEELRSELSEQGISIWHHVDAAFGGYLAAALRRDEDGRALDFETAGETLIEEDVYRSISAAADSNSITIDPHKWGYVPYPAGAVLFRDYRVRDAIGFSAPYLPSLDDAGFGGFIGRWTLEGSRAGAPAVGAYLAQAVMPLDHTGHGALIRDCVEATRAIVAELRDRFDDGPTRLVLLADPDTVGFCFVLVPRDGALGIRELNEITLRIWSNVSMDGDREPGRYDYLLSRTDLHVGTHRQVLEGILPEVLSGARDEDGLTMLRVFVVNPFVAEWSRRPDSFARRFADFMWKLSRAEVEPRADAGGSTVDDAPKPAAILVAQAAVAP